jgi:uncharacterized repeat protein (TIGR03803 family)
MTPSGTLTTLYSFCSQPVCADGDDPLGALIQATDGNLYGTTAGGGTAGRGTVFKITLSGTLTTLASFNGTDGQAPEAGLVQGSDGNFYGTAARGGANTCQVKSGEPFSCGAVFKVTPSGTLTALASFTQAGGFYSQAPLMQASDGNFYGAAFYGGGTAKPGLGTIFKSTPTGTLSVLHRFAGTDGQFPLGGLVQGTDGNLYGTTSFGGGNPGFGGTVFKISLTGTLTTLHSFGGGDGTTLSAGLLHASDGNFYGTAAGGGQGSGFGTLFKITPSGTLTSLFAFNGTDGESPVSTLFEGPTGLLYGTTEFGANSACTGGCGTVFSLAAGLN